MAGTRKFCSSTMLLNFVRFLLFCELTSSVLCLQCKSQQNAPVDWFIAIKLPASTNLPKNSFYYMDANSKSWSVSVKTLTDSGQAIYNTLDQIYQKSENASTGMGDVNFMYMMYNDEIPKSLSESETQYDSETLYWHPHHRSVEHGHTKGVIGFDDDAGFWLVHSAPHFPPVREQGYSYPDSASIYGQSFLCVSMATDKNVNELGIQLQYNYPHIYDQNIPKPFAAKYPQMDAALKGQHVTKEPWFRQKTLVSLSGTEFVSFAKFAYFNQDMYSDWLAPVFGDTLLVETWQNGRNKLCSNCTGKYKVYNIAELKFDSGDVTVKETQDHSKWVVTNSSSNTWTCIGDINRQQSQMGRSGGTVCLQDSSVWNNFRQTISTFHDCNPYGGCVKSNRP